MAGKIKVPSELVPSQSNQVMLRSKYIYDDIKGHTQEEVNAALEEQIESKVIEASGVIWDVVPTADSEDTVKSKDIKAALEKVTGYFVLDSNITESTVAKTVTVADFQNLALGGSIKIKMLTKNTAANPTLRLGASNAPAYPLYYNNERASADNTWEENEVISVYFDGTNYQASNAQGGGGKAEKIKYDNTQSVFSAENVQEALDEIAMKVSNTENELSVSRSITLTRRTTGYDSTSLNLEADTTYRVVTEFNKGVTANDSAVIMIVPIASSADNAINITPTVHIGDSVVEKIITTDSANVHQYLRWFENDQNNTATVKFYKISSNSLDIVPKLYDSLGKNSDGAINQETITKLLTKGIESYSEPIDVNDFQIYNGHINDGNWDTSYGKFIVIPTVGLDSVYLGTPTNQSLFWIPLKSFTEPVSGAAIDYCDGFSGSQTVGPNISTTVNIPDDCNYLVVYRYLGENSQYNVTPLSIILNYKAIVSVSNIEGSINTDTTKIGETPIYASENGKIYNNGTTVQICSKFIPIKPSTKYRFTSDKYNVLCILTSNSYTAGQNINNFATGESIRTISAGGTLELTTPSDAAYALLRTTVSDDTPITISIKEIIDVSTALALYESKISKVENSVEKLSFKDAVNIRYSDFYDSSLSDNEIWDIILSATSFIPKKNIVIDRDMTISRVLYVYSNTTIYIDNVTIKQEDDVFDNVFRGINEIPTTSEGYEIVAGENLELLENIKILGVGNARIEGPESASKIATDSYGLRTVQVLFDRVKGLEIGNITYSKTRGWCHCFMFVEDAYIHDILFDNLKDGANRDGFDFRSGCHNIVVENVGGRTGDDLFAFHAHNVASLDGTREGYSSNGVRRYFCAQYIDKLNNENRVSELDVHDCRINNAYKYNGYWHVGICLAAHGTYTYNISITNINVGGHITSGQSYIQGLITLYKYGNYVDDHMHDILVSNVVNDSDSNMPVFNNDCKVSNVWVNKLVNNTANKTADIQYGDGVTLLNTENYHRISGTFTQSGTALVNKEIVFTSDGVSYKAKTNSNGYNTFLPAGTYTVTCNGYTLDISSVTIGSSDVVQDISAT